MTANPLEGGARVMARELRRKEKTCRDLAVQVHEANAQLRWRLSRLADAHAAAAAVYETVLLEVRP